MLIYNEVADSNWVEITVDGPISKTEMESVAAKLEEALQRHGKLNLLEDIRRIEGMEMAAFWEDIKFSLRHLNDFSRVAVVGDADWLDWVVKVLAPFTRAQVRHFEREKIEQARQWLDEPVV